MAATVAQPLERQFAQIAGLTDMTSTSTLGATSIGLQFDLDRTSMPRREPSVSHQSPLATCLSESEPARFADPGHRQGASRSRRCAFGRPRKLQTRGLALEDVRTMNALATSNAPKGGKRCKSWMLNPNGTAIPRPDWRFCSITGEGLTEKRIRLQFGRAHRGVLARHFGEKRSLGTAH
jgi:hypothetical protein